MIWWGLAEYLNISNHTQFGLRHGVYPRPLAPFLASVGSGKPSDVRRKSVNSEAASAPVHGYHQQVVVSRAYQACKLEALIESILICIS